MGTASDLGYFRWTANAPDRRQSAKLLVGDPIALAENLKILKQYSKLLTQACSQRHDHQASHAQALSQSPTVYPRNLQWFETLASPCAQLDPAGADRITELLRLHAACDKSVPQDTRLQAYQLAQSLPHFDRDLTFYYLGSTTISHEYELHVAHSIMRLHTPSSPDSLCPLLDSWRNQGLLHVLHVAALNMPTLQDWFPAEPSVTNDALVLCLETLNERPREYAHAIESFIATQDHASPTAQAIASTLDRLAILMSVKSNAVDPADHDLERALRSFPDLEHAPPAGLWKTILPALETHLPPSILRVASCIRKRVKKQGVVGSWCVSQLPVHTQDVQAALQVVLDPGHHPAEVAHALDVRGVPPTHAARPGVLVDRAPQIEQAHREHVQGPGLKRVHERAQTALHLLQRDHHRGLHPVPLAVLTEAGGHLERALRHPRSHTALPGHARAASSTASRASSSTVSRTASSTRTASRAASSTRTASRAASSTRAASRAASSTRARPRHRSRLPTPGLQHNPSR